METEYGSGCVGCGGQCKGVYMTREVGGIVRSILHVNPVIVIVAFVKRSLH